MKNKSKIIAGAVAIVLLVFIGISFEKEVPQDEKETITVGVIIPLTGIRADAGEFAKNGVEIAMDEINSGKFRKYNAELIFEDTKYAPQSSVSAIQKLINIDKVKYLIGPYGSSQVLAVAPIAEESKVILITPGSQSSDVSTIGDYIFRNIHNATQEGPVFAKFVASKMSGDTLHFITMNAAFTDSYLSNFLPTLEKEGKKVGLTEGFDVSAADFRTQLLKVKAENPTDIFPIATPKHMGILLKQAYELGIDANFYHIGVEGPDLIDIAGDTAEGVFYPYSYDSQSSQKSIKNFYKKYLDKFSHEPDTIAANAYDAMYNLYDCFEEVGDNVDLVKGCLYNIQKYDGASGTYGFDENGDAIKNIIIKTVKDGQLVRYE